MPWTYQGGNQTFSSGGQDAAGVEFETMRSETPKASRVWKMGRGISPRQPTSVWGGLYAPPAGSGAEPRPKTILLLSERLRTPLVAKMSPFNVVLEWLLNCFISK